MLYLKVAELLSSGLQTAIDQIRAGKLCLSSTVKQGELCTPRGIGGGHRRWSHREGWGSGDEGSPGAGPAWVGSSRGSRALKGSLS